MPSVAPIADFAPAGWNELVHSVRAWPAGEARLGANNPDKRRSGDQLNASQRSRRSPLTSVTLADVSDVDELVRRCQDGDVAAFRQLFEMHRQDVARLVYRMLGSSPDLEDVVQEVFVQVYRSIRDFKGTARFSTWLYRVAVNVVLMHRRAARSRPQLDESLAEQELSDHEPLPDDRAAQRLRVRAFYRLLERLSEKKRTVYVLHELDGMVPAEIARIVNAPVLTVRTRLFYARREVAVMLAEEPVLAGLASDESLVRPGARAERTDAAASSEKEPAV